MLSASLVWLVKSWFSGQLAVLSTGGVYIVPFSSKLGLPPNRLISSGTLASDSAPDTLATRSPPSIIKYVPPKEQRACVLRSVMNAVSYVPYCNVSGRSSSSMMVVVANTHTSIHGISSGDISFDRHERLDCMTWGRAASSESVEHRGSST